MLADERSFFFDGRAEPKARARKRWRGRSRSSCNRRGMATMRTLYNENRSGIDMQFIQAAIGSTRLTSKHRFEGGPRSESHRLTAQQ